MNRQRFDATAKVSELADHSRSACLPRPFADCRTPFLYEPVVFYSSDRKLPVELVINSISKNHIHGYISEPKYKAAELEAMANPSANNAATGTNNLQSASPAKPSPVRQRLEPPNMN